MKKLTNIAFILLILLAFGCETESTVEGFEISGAIKGHENAQIYLDRYNPYGNEHLDSMATDAQGHFSFTHANPSDQLYLLRLPNNQSVMFFPELGKLKLSTNLSQFSGANIEGSAWSKELFRFSNKRAQLRGNFVNASRSLQMIDRASNKEKWMRQEARADAAMEIYRDYVRAYIDTVSKPEIALLAAANLNPDGNFYYLQELIKVRRSAWKTSEIFKYLDHIIQEGSKHFLAHQALNFVGVNHQGDSISLDQFKGKPVYLYVWASYCGLSRAENKRLVTCRSNHPDNEIEILTFSIDELGDEWKNAIEEDGMNWIGQLRGQFNWKSPEIRQFAIESIPTSFLLDARGIIRTKNLHARELDTEYASLLERWGKKEGQ